MDSSIFLSDISVIVKLIISFAMTEWFSTTYLDWRLDFRSRLFFSMKLSCFQPWGNIKQLTISGLHVQTQRIMIETPSTGLQILYPSDSKSMSIGFVYFDLLNNVFWNVWKYDLMLNKFENYPVCMIY